MLALFFGLPISHVATAQDITIGAYNVQNFFDVFDDPYANDEDVAVKSRRQIEAIAKAVQRLDADVLVFQELENEHLLQAMVDEFLPNAGYEYVAAQRTNSGRGINLGVVSRYPIVELRSFRFTKLTNPKAPDREWRFARDVMQVAVDVGLDRPVNVYSIHLKSNRDGPDDPNSRLYRTAEAIALKNIVRAEVEKDPGYLGVLAGDFNSNYETRPEQPRPWPAMEHLLAPEDDGTRLLTDVHAHLSDEARVTIPGSGRFPPATFDYVLVTPAMAERYVRGSAKIVKGRALTSGSDHYPVAASFRIGRKR
ncbi:MAG: endonuclease/exonuclease/phosphatase family protein [Planctomycetota bacterium]